MPLGNTVLPHLISANNGAIQTNDTELHPQKNCEVPKISTRNWYISHRQVIQKWYLPGLYRVIKCIQT